MATVIVSILLGGTILGLLVHGILRGRTVIRWLCILVVLLLVFLSIMPWPGPPSRERVRQVHCMSNLRQIAMATQAYRVDHGNAWPKSFLDLTNGLQNPKVFRCISTGNEPGALANVPEWTDYVFCSPPGENELLAYCVPEHHKNRGGNIVFADGSVQFLKPEEFADVLKTGNEMNWFVDRVLGFFIENFPSWKAIAIGGPLGLAWSFAALWFAGKLKQNGTRTGYTRKVFHLLIFTTVALLQWRFGTSAVCLFGGMTTLAVFFAVWRGPGNMLYEAMAREKDEPHRTFFILVPYFTTLVGGLVSNMIFGPIAVAGYLVTGLGDAIGEPAGTMFGKHHYRVRSLSSVPATRSLEGSTAVFIMSAVAITLAALVSPQITLAHFGILKILLIAGASALAEAVSPHGWDNATMQVLPTALVWLWM